MQRIRQKSSGTYPLSVETTSDEGATVNAVAPVTLTIRDGAGVEVVTGAAPEIATGKLTYAVDRAALAQMDTYSVVWTGTVDGEVLEWPTTVEICGGYLFEIAEMRAFDSAFVGGPKYSDARMRAARTAAEQRLERACRVAFVPRARRLAATGDGTSTVFLTDNAVRRVVSLAVDDVAFDVAQLDVREWGRVTRSDGLPFEDGAGVDILYEHGEDYPDAPVVQAAMLLAREYLVRSALSSRATVEATDVGFFRVSVAGPDRPTGLPEVDAVIADFGRRRPLVL